MRFDPFILFFIIIVFFILPSLLKKILSVKKAKILSDKTAAPGTTAVPGIKTASEEVRGVDVFKTDGKTMSIFEKIGRQAGEFIQKVREQAIQQQLQQQQSQQQSQQQRRAQQPIQVRQKRKQQQQKPINRIDQTEKDQNNIWDILAEKIDDNFYESRTIVSQNQSQNKKTKSEQSDSTQVDSTQVDSTQVDSVQSDSVQLDNSVQLENEHLENEQFEDRKSEFGRVVSKKTEQVKYKIPSSTKTPSIEKKYEPGSVSCKNYRFKTDPLQNAVILSEILSKPLALKNR